MSPPLDSPPRAIPLADPSSSRGARQGTAGPVPRAHPRTSLRTEVVLITDNSEADLARSLPAIREAVRVAHAELLVVDLGSVDGTLAFASRHCPGARGVWLARGDGLSEALTAAAACSEADVLVILRPTVQPTSPDAIRRLVRHLEDHPYASVAAPSLRDHRGAELHTSRPGPGPSAFSRVEWVVSEAIALRRRDLDGLVGLRRVPAHTFEQLELCIRLRCRGREIHYLRSGDWRDVGGRAARRLSAGQRGLSLRAWRLLLAHPAYALRLLGRHRAVVTVSSFLRRAVDIAGALALLVALAPLMLAIMLAIRLDSPGPAIFRQRRLGHRARPFQMFKFRTMTHGSDPALHEEFVREMILNRLQAREGGAIQIFKIHPDPRVTRVGRLLRRTSLDELPQLLNILRGEMTFVGFRPPIPYEVEDYPAWYFRRFDGRPGVTGLWQVSGRNERSYEEMVSLDIEYHNRRTWLFDLLLLARTIGVVLTGRGAY